MTELHKEDVSVQITDPDMLLRLRDYYIALGAEIAGFEVEDLTLTVKLTVDGEDIFPRFELMIADEFPTISLLVLKDTVDNDSNESNHWYVLRYGKDGKFKAEQYRLVHPDSSTHLGVETFAALGREVP